MTDYIIQTDALNFQYSKYKKVLENISINVPKGSIYGFLGPNGAGKSTTMRLLTGIIPEQGNAIKLFNEPLQEQLPLVFSKIGSLVESPALYLHLSGIDNLRYIAKLRNIPEDKIHETLALVDLTRDGKRKAKQYSLGMKQRLAIAMALLSEPELLLLDEPVNGLDPNGIIDIRKLLIKLNQEKGVTIFVSSHLLSEIEKMCTHVGIISKGKLRFEGTMQELSKAAGLCKIQVTVDDARQWQEKLSTAYENVTVIAQNQITLEIGNKDQIPDFIKNLIAQNASLYEIKILDGLEEWFMTITDEKNTYEK
ncbi:ATP-binding cassette domain-containing protein [Flavobacterium silvisoli]|uniref:ATP-binding cassette domain-containing protein n=1 Tax=Flavobacterium silvisoli TaxID=2529433 RepID=A0A4Q9YP11_9FLAO|nr:ATP-binding cassette domain-containing protein [Flavobacterium silvisoli]TBX64999.1 ATP-binding cassette domain-containing protein [Flavobacterium silvisoli]